MSIDKINKKIQQLQSEDWEKMPTRVALAKKEQLNRLLKEKELLFTKVNTKSPYLYIVKDGIVYFNTAFVDGKPILFGKMDLFEYWFNRLPQNVFKQIPVSLLPEANTLEASIKKYKEIAQ